MNLVFFSFCDLGYFGHNRIISLILTDKPERLIQNSVKIIHHGNILAREAHETGF